MRLQCLPDTVAIQTLLSCSTSRLVEGVELRMDLRQLRLGNYRLPHGSWSHTEHIHHMGTWSHKDLEEKVET